MLILRNIFLSGHLVTASLFFLAVFIWGLCDSTTALAGPERGRGDLFSMAADKTATNVVVVKETSPEFSLTLSSNPTTGYIWFLESFDRSLIKVISRTYRAPKTRAAGAPGVETWKFKALPGAFAVPRISYVRFVQIRPWDSSDPVDEEEFTILLASRP